MTKVTTISWNKIETIKTFWGIPFSKKVIQLDISDFEKNWPKWEEEFMTHMVAAMQKQKNGKK